MTLFIFKVITIIFNTLLIHKSLTRFLHIFQLTFYNFTEFFPTIKKTKECKYGIAQLVLTLVVILTAFFNMIWCYIIWILAIVIIIYYTNMFKPKEKKKFVITKRVKITYTISYIFEIVLIIIPSIYFAYKNILPFYIFALLLANYKYLGLIFACIGNAITKPIMKVMNNKYINEAKNIIKSNSNMKVIGITGSYGKTSTKNIINSILSECFSTVMTPKSFNTTLGVTKSIREDIKPYTEVFVCEMGAARLGEIAEICSIAKPDISVITSIGPQHLTSFKTIENVQKGKFEIVTDSKKENVAILNIDNEYIFTGIDMYAKDRKVITYAIDKKEKADVYAENIVMNENGSSFDVVFKDKSIHVQTKLLGKHNIYNVLCAIVIANYLNVSDDKIIKVVKKLRPVEHRLELKNMGNILTLDDSFNSNPEGSKSAIECLCMFENKYRVLVTPGMIELGDKEYELNKNLGKYASKCDFVILVGEKTTGPIKEGLKEESYKNYVIVKDVYEAFDRLEKMKNEHQNLIALIENDLPDSYS